MVVVLWVTDPPNVHLNGCKLVLIGQQIARGSMGSAQRGEGRIVLVASKPTTIAYRWVSLNNGTFTGMYGCIPAAATLAFLLPFPLLKCF